VTVKIRLLLADDHALVRQGLLNLLSHSPSFEVVAEASNGREAAALAAQLSPDVVVLDVSMPDLNGMETARRIRSADPNVKILALSMHGDTQMVREMLECGASGYVLKSASFSELQEAICAVARGEIHLGPGLDKDLLRDCLRPDSSGRGPAGRLSSRQAEVLQLISEGRTTKEIASLLGISVKTVETYRNQIMSRLKIHSIAGLTKYALREGLTEP
jgi:DNA-binding NarL/FixJ family response regulator